MHKKYLKIKFFLIFILFFNLTSYADLLSELKDGQHVLFMRHANAPGIGDPIGFKLDDCKSQRNLDEVGRNQAIKIGAWLRAQGIKEAMIYSSPWCRCIDTANLLNIGKVTIEQSVSSIFNDPKLENQSKNDLQQFIKYKLSTRSNLPIIFVTHQVNIEAFTNQFVLSGGILLVEVDNNGKYLTHKELIQ